MMIEMDDDGRPGGLSSDDGAASVSTLRASIPDAAMWPLRITTYQPSHRQFCLSEDLSPEQITDAVGAEPNRRATGDGKVTLEWRFWAEATFPKPGGGFLSTSIGCKIWDYEGSRWSAYGWPEAFEKIGLTPILSKDYGGWQYQEDGNETLRLIAQGMSAGTAENAPQAQGEARQPGPQDAPTPTPETQHD